MTEKFVIGAGLRGFSMRIWQKERQADESGESGSPQQKQWQCPAPPPNIVIAGLADYASAVAMKKSPAPIRNPKGSS